MINKEMIFEYDPNKSDVNKQKHGINFEEAQSLRLDPRRIEIDARTVGEPRKLLIATLENEIWSLIYTLRNSKIRIISARKSRKNEKEIYYNPGI
jgi:uncharacterized DUF497 family protein